MEKTQVGLIKTPNRARGVTRSIGLLNPEGIKGQEVLIKPNFNTADPAPGSTHNDTLRQLIEELKKLGAQRLVIGERSYHSTDRVIKEKEVDKMAEELEIEIMNFDNLSPDDWVEFRPEHSHWKDGFHVARPILEAETIVSTCCLKTHRHGGIFTLSLKLSVGIVPIRGYDYMDELHSSPHQRKMIAELNQAYEPSLIVMDGVEAFVDGGPDTGARKKAHVMLAGTDRVAMDAVGVAILKELGSNQDIMKREIFSQEQIARAVEIGIGISSPQQIELLTDDEESKQYAEKIRTILDQG